MWIGGFSVQLQTLDVGGSQRKPLSFHQGIQFFISNT